MNVPNAPAEAAADRRALSSQSNSDRRLNDLFALNGLLLAGILFVLGVIAWRLGPIAESNVRYAKALEEIAKIQGERLPYPVVLVPGKEKD